MSKSILFLLFFVSTVGASSKIEGLIERDLQISISHLQHLIDLDVSELTHNLSEKEKLKFEAEVFQIKEISTRLREQFSQRTRFPSAERKKK